MKTRYFLIILAILFMPANLYAAEKPLIDPAYKEVEAKIEKKKKAECNKIKNIYNRMQCGKKLLVAARNEGKMRGSEEYCEKQYADLDFKKLKALWIKLKESQKTARRSLNVMEDEDRQLGEITQEDLQTEIEWVESRLAQMQKDGTKNIKKGLRYKDLTTQTN